MGILTKCPLLKYIIFFFVTSKWTLFREHSLDSRVWYFSGDSPLGSAASVRVWANESSFHAQCRCSR